MKTPFRRALVVVTLLASLLSLTGCAESVSDDYSVTEAPGIRITSEAMEALHGYDESFHLNYTERFA